MCPVNDVSYTAYLESVNRVKEMVLRLLPAHFGREGCGRSVFSCDSWVDVVSDMIAVGVDLEYKNNLAFYVVNES